MCVSTRFYLPSLFPCLLPFVFFLFVFLVFVIPSIFSPAAWVSPLPTADPCLLAVSRVCAHTSGREGRVRVCTDVNDDVHISTHPITLLPVLPPWDARKVRQAGKETAQMAGKPATLIHDKAYCSCKCGVHVYVGVAARVPAWCIHLYICERHLGIAQQPMGKATHAEQCRPLRPTHPTPSRPPACALLSFLPV